MGEGGGVAAGVAGEKKEMHSKLESSKIKFAGFFPDE